MQNEKKKFEPRDRRPMDGEADGLIEGRNAVTEALRAGTTIDKIYIARGETDATLGHIASTARNKGIVVVEADRRKLDGMSRTKSHQGVIAVSAVREYASVDDILNAAREKGEAPLIVVKCLPCVLPAASPCSERRGRRPSAVPTAPALPSSPAALSISHPRMPWTSTVWAPRSWKPSLERS